MNTTTENPSSLLLINASPRGERSASRKLANEYLATWKAANPAGQAVVRDLAVDQPPVLTEAWVAGAYSAPEQRSPEAQAAIAVSDQLVDELLASQEIVVATPVYNFSVPGALKLWIDQIVRFGRTFLIDAEGYKGLAGGRRVKVLVTSGGDLRLGQPFGAMNFVEPYLRGLFGFIGITEVEFVYAHSQSSEKRDEILAEAINATRSLVAA